MAEKREDVYKALEEKFQPRIEEAEGVTVETCVDTKVILKMLEQAKIEAIKKLEKVEALETQLEDSRKKVLEIEELYADKYQRWKEKQQKLADDALKYHMLLEENKKLSDEIEKKEKSGQSLLGQSSRRVTSNKKEKTKGTYSALLIYSFHCVSRACIEGYLHLFCFIDRLLSFCFMSREGKIRPIPPGSKLKMGD